MMIIVGEPGLESGGRKASWLGLSITGNAARSLLFRLVLVGAGLFVPVAQAIQTEGIRSFLSNPKPLEHYLYEIRSDSDSAPGVAPTTNSSGKVQYVVTRPQIVRGCWNSETMNWAQNLTSTNISPEERFGFFVGRMNNLYWEAHDGYLTTYNPEFNTPDKRTVMMIGAMAHQHACIILRLGLTHIDFPGATWEGLAFKAMATRGKFTPKEKAYPVGGQIQDSGLGRFQITVTNLESGTFERRVILSYRPSDSVYPQSMEIFDRLEYNDGSIRDNTRRVSIYEVRQASTPLPPEFFDPQKISALGRKLTTFYSNDARYAVSPHNSKDVYRMMKTEEVAEQARLAAKPQSGSIFFRGALITLLVVPLGLLVWRTLKRNKTT
jgi:hypothetical protein